MDLTPTTFTLHNNGDLLAIAGAAAPKQIDSGVETILVGPDGTLYDLHSGGSLSSIAPGSSFSLQSIASAVQKILADNPGNIYRLDSNGSLYVLAPGSSPTPPSNWLTAHPAGEADTGVRSITPDSGGTRLTSCSPTETIGNSPAQPELRGRSHLLVIRPGGGHGPAGFPVTVTVLDDHNEPVTAYMGTVHFAVTSGFATLPGDYPFTMANAGTHPFMLALDTVNTQTQLVEDGGPSGQIVKMMTPYNGGDFVTYVDGTTYYTPDGLFPAGGGNDPPDSYSGSAIPIAMAAVNGGVLTAFNNGDVFFSPHGQYLGGGGGNTVQVFDPGTTGEYVTLLTPYKGGVFVTFNIGTTYFTPDGLHPAGGGNDPDAYAGTAIPTAMAVVNGGADRVQQRQDLLQPRRPVPGGGGGNTVQVFDPGSTGEYVTLLTPYNGGVFVTFNIGTTYFTPDGLNPAGGGSGIDVYSGSAHPIAITPYDGGVLTAFDNGNIDFSPDGQNLGGGGQTQVVYSGTQHVVAMEAVNGGVLTAFDSGNIYPGPNGQNLGDATNTLTATGGSGQTFTVTDTSTGISQLVYDAGTTGATVKMLTRTTEGSSSPSITARPTSLRWPQSSSRRRQRSPDSYSGRAIPIAME